eukprot:Anaeramoba_ignava/a351044_66.p1 GENE.a351044_66~~a351044_66.p1  ORF type:complete len:722 (+),score=213.54 a351044_66:107-2272(+)
MKSQKNQENGHKKSTSINFKEEKIEIGNQSINNKEKSNGYQPPQIKINGDSISRPISAPPNTFANISRISSLFPIKKDDSINKSTTLRPKEFDFRPLPKFFLEEDEVNRFMKQLKMNSEAKEESNDNLENKENYLREITKNNNKTTNTSFDSKLNFGMKDRNSNLTPSPFKPKENTSTKQNILMDNSTEQRNEQTFKTQNPLSLFSKQDVERFPKIPQTKKSNSTLSPLKPSFSMPTWAQPPQPVMSQTKTNLPPPKFTKLRKSHSTNEPQNITFFKPTNQFPPFESNVNLNQEYPPFQLSYQKSYEQSYHPNYTNTNSFSSDQGNQSPYFYNPYQNNTQDFNQFNNLTWTPQYPPQMNDPIQNNYFNGLYPQLPYTRNTGLEQSQPQQNIFSHNINQLSLSFFFGHIAELSFDQHGSKLIQQKLESATEFEREQVFKEIKSSFMELIKNTFGNYVIQKFLLIALPTHITSFLSIMKGKFYEISTHIYGCRVVQKAIEVAKEEEQAMIISELKEKILDCIDDQNGNHVIQKCIECVPQKHIQFIVDTFAKKPIELSKHPYGCRVIQRILNHCTGPEVDHINKEILRLSNELVFDQFGNYVIQHMLENGTNEQRNTIIQKVFGKVLKMSQHKYASNAIEKCIEFGTAQQTKKILNEILANVDALRMMVNDQYANYVIQKFLERAKGKDQQRLVSALKQNLNLLDTNSYGKHVLTKMTTLGWI